MSGSNNGNGSNGKLILALLKHPPVRQLLLRRLAF